MNLKDVRIEFYKSRGPGGQHKNKRFMAVRASHIPTGLVAISQEYRSQALNKKVALERLKERIVFKTKPRKFRVETRVPRAVKENILAWKKRQSLKKRLRREKIKVDG